MANTLTGLVQTIYQGLDVVSRENVGAIMSVSRNADAAQAAVGQTVRTPITAVATASDIVAAMVPANSGGQVVTHKDFTISKSRKAEVLWTGEEILGTSQYSKILADQFAQAFRTLSNEVESDIVAAALAGATGEAFVVDGADLFSEGNVMKDAAALNRAMRDAGLDGQVRNVILDSAAQANLESAPNLFKVNESGSASIVNDGIISRLAGLNFYSSAEAAESVILTPNAVQLVARTPALPMAGDVAVDRMQVTDPKSGLVFDVAMYAGYHQVKIEVSLAWGVGVIKPESIFTVATAE